MHTVEEQYERRIIVSVVRSYFEKVMHSEKLMIPNLHRQIVKE